MSFLSPAVMSANPSPTLALNAKANQLKAEGVDIINLTAGEPDFDTPAWIKQAAYESMEQGMTKYTAVSGVPKLREAIAKKLKRDNEIEYNPDEIIVGCGAKHVIFTALMATLCPGDEVIIPSPYWVSYPEMVRIFGGNPVIIPCTEEQGFKLSPSHLEKAITPRTKWLIINSPGNPTGAVYTREELKALAEIIQNHENLHVISDDIYEHIIYEEKFATLAQVAPALKNRILTVNGLSKSYAMTGWRVGYGAGNKSLIQAMTMLQSQSVTNVTSIAQGAAIGALNGTQEFLQDWRESFQSRRDYCLERIGRISGLSCLKPQGAFYLFIGAQNLMGCKTKAGATISSDEDLGSYLLEEAGVAVVHGSAFGAQGYFRISYATSQENLEKAWDRTEKAIQSLSRA
jgi:aspartate aminotransferase